MGIKYKKRSSNIQNNICMDYNYKRLFKKCLSMFKWENLPSTIDERYLEMNLITKGYICFFKDNELGSYLALDCSLGGRFNVYNIPTNYEIYTASGYHARRDITNSVIIWNNYIHEGLITDISYNARRISDVERTIDVNLNNLKRPFIFLVPENKKTSVKIMLDQIKDNEDAIIGSNDLGVENFNINNTITPNNTLELYTLKKRLYNEALSDLGINNFNTDKKERMLQDEITSNDEEIYLTRAGMLEARKEACRQINEMFGLNIDVHYRNIEVNNEPVNEYDVNLIKEEIS